MTNGLTEMEKWKVLRTVIGGCEKDTVGMPVIKNSFPESLGGETGEWEKTALKSYKNLKAQTENGSTIALMFKYDKVLAALWNNPLKYVGLFSSCFAVSSPDFSVYPNMDENEIRHNVFMNRWLGVQWQNLGCRVIPCISWADESTYDICFSGVEKGCVVIISTLGVKRTPELFLKGFFEMKKRLEPVLIIVYGDFIPGMTGRFLFCRYTESFTTEAEFSGNTLFDMPRIVEIPEIEGGN